MRNIVDKVEYTPELEIILSYMNNELPKLFAVNVLSVEHFVYSVLVHPDSVAYQALNKILLESTIESLKEFYVSAFRLVNSGCVAPELHDLLRNAINDNTAPTISSAHILLNILEKEASTRNVFESLGVILNEATNALKETISEPVEKGETPFKHKKRMPAGKPSRDVQGIVGSVKETNEIEKFCTNLNTLAEEGKVDEVIGNKDIIESILNILCKKNKNNVVVTGDSGIGKTATVKHLANLIVRNEVPKRFKNKKIMVMDFMSLITNTQFRGAFESRFENIVKDAKGGNYIIFIDDIQSILSEKSKFGEVDILSVLDKILLEKSIGVVATCSTQGYRIYFETNPALSRRFQRIQMKQPSVNEAIEILHSAKGSFELYHNVKYTDKAIEVAVKMGNRYLSNVKLPDSAIDLIDETAAKKVLWMKTPEGLDEYQKKLDNIIAEIEEIKNSKEKNYNLIDSLTEEQIRLKSKIAQLEKDEILLSAPTVVDDDDVRIVIANKTNIPVTQVTADDKAKLKNIANTLKQYVVGQDDAVDAVSKVIKRQRVGIANPNKPSVFLFVGHTGTGKTYLAKKIAQEVFGDEKYLVRLDMSEFADKMSVNRLYGSAPGYVGFEQGGQLTEAIKKNKYCVLLLDEIEKANEEVHNVFLQMFDEGRLTDNMGTTVDFKNVIIIMTSNVGARKLSEYGNGIGFVNSDKEATVSILDKELKKSFKSEFLNRINKVVFFNKLTDDNLKNIVKLEIANIGKKLEDLGYKLDKNFADSPVADEIYETVRKDKSFGARPIMRQIEDRIEDVLTDYLLDHEVEQGHTFTYKELYQ